MHSFAVKRMGQVINEFVEQIGLYMSHKKAQKGPEKK
jgi:hypothetical protein